ncbi:MAG TPA: cytochrome c biogenesis protein CcdA [Methanoregulaceae archaeon]|nr:cytochrome c biogenesis protein CcdA [Methanoregulaceae archaeon]
MTLADLSVAFTAGLLSPLGAACVLPLYPGYLAFLAAQQGDSADECRIPYLRILLGFTAGAGILAAMLGFGLLVGVIFTLPIGDVLSIVSPLAYALLGAIGILLILGAGSGLPFRTPDILKGKSPLGGAFLFGLFFGILILPCNAGPVTVLLALSTSALDFASNLGNFLAYGLGMAIPLIAISAVSTYKGHRIVQALADHRRTINIATGILMISVAAYYLLVVFRIQDWIFPS